MGRTERPKRNIRRPIRFQDFVASFRTRYPDYEVELSQPVEAEDKKNHCDIDVFELWDEFHLPELFQENDLEVELGQLDFDGMILTNCEKVDRDEHSDPEEVLVSAFQMEEH